MKANLKRMASPSLFGADIQDLAFQAEMQTDNRLHFKVENASFFSSLLNTSPCRCTSIFWQPQSQINFKHCFWSKECLTQILYKKDQHRTQRYGSLHLRHMNSCFSFFQIYDAKRQRFEVPQEHISSLKSDPSGTLSHTLEITHKPFGLTVRRKENKKALWVVTTCVCVLYICLCQIGERLFYNAHNNRLFYVERKGNTRQNILCIVCAFNKD